MRALGHEHDGFKAELLGVAQKLLQAKPGLSRPKAAVAHRVEGSLHHRSLLYDSYSNRPVSPGLGLAAVRRTARFCEPPLNAELLCDRVRENVRIGQCRRYQRVFERNTNRCFADVCGESLAACFFSPPPA